MWRVQKVAISYEKLREFFYVSTFQVILEIVHSSKVGINEGGRTQQQVGTSESERTQQ